jgi:uncharacterized membrane protein YcaP (DUF421 family)
MLFDPLAIMIRVILAFAFLLAVTKFLTKRNLSNLTYFDYGSATILGTIAGNLVFNTNIHFLNFILSLALTTMIVILASYLSLRNRSIRKLLAGEPTILIQNGKILENNMAKLYFPFDYLNQSLREEKVFDISQVEYAILEPSGKLSIKLKAKNRTLTPADLNLTTKNEYLVTEVIIDGQIIKTTLHRQGLNEQWLYEELKKKEIYTIEDASYAVFGSNGKLYVDKYCDY